MNKIFKLTNFNQTKNMKQVYAVQDDSGHWYVIQYEMKDTFFALDEKMGSENEVEFNEAEEEFNKLFSQYITGGDLNNVQLYAEI